MKWSFVKIATRRELILFLRQEYSLNNSEPLSLRDGNKLIFTLLFGEEGNTFFNISTLFIDSPPLNEKRYPPIIIKTKDGNALWVNVCEDLYFKNTRYKSSVNSLSGKLSSLREWRFQESILSSSEMDRSVIFDNYISEKVKDQIFDVLKTTPFRERGTINITLNCSSRSPESESGEGGALTSEEEKGVCIYITLVKIRNGEKESIFSKVGVDGFLKTIVIYDYSTPFVGEYLPPGSLLSFDNNIEG